MLIQYGIRAWVRIPSLSPCGIPLIQGSFRYGVPIIFLVRFLFSILLSFSMCRVQGKNVLTSAELISKLVRGLNTSN